MPLLADDFTVVAMDRRGRGRSGPFAAAHSLAIEYGDVATVAMAIGGSVHLVGHSSGARYALHAALGVPDLATLVLYEPPEPEAISERVIEKLDRLRETGDRQTILWTFFVEVLGMTGEDFFALQRRPVWPLMVDNALTVPAELRAARSYRFDDRAFAELTVPTTLLVGDLSDQELRQVVHRLADVLPAAKIVTLLGQGHGAMISAPELFVSVLHRIFDRTIDRLADGASLPEHPRR